MYVADRLIDAVCQIDYPRELLEIQVLDDSTDETRKRLPSVPSAATRPAASTSTYIHRTDRTGYKAGALEAGMKVAKGEFIAIFDADFIPTDRLPAAHRARSSSTRRSRMVQARWGHINQDYSLLTKIQSILLDAHFVLEHGARNRGGLFFNFNGTAGIWRRDGDRRRRRLAARHADRGPRPELPRPAPRLEVHLPPRPGRARRSAGRDELLQVAAAPLGEGVDPDLPQAAAAHPAFGPAARRQGRGVLPPDRQLQLPADVRAVGADGAVDGHPLQHGLVRDAADRRAAVLGGDGVGRQLLHGLPARAAQRLDDAARSTCRS